MNKMNNKNNGKGKQNGKNNKQVQTAPAVKEKKVKAKTPAGHFRFRGENYPLLTDGIPDVRLYCRSCRAENIRVLGKIVYNGEMHYVVKCPFHPEEATALSEAAFRQRYPGILPEETVKDTSETTPEGYPVVKSYCKCSRATTAVVIGESASGFSWLVRCTECGAEWKEDKERFAEKYMGVDGNPPIYPQTEPQGRSQWNDPSEQNGMSDKLAEFTPARVISAPSGKADSHDEKPSQKQYNHCSGNGGLHEEIAKNNEACSCENKQNDNAHVGHDVVVCNENGRVIVVGQDFGLELHEGQSFSINVDEHGKIHLRIH